MLKPAMAYKDQLDELFANVMYDDDYFLYMGYAHGHELPKIEPLDNIYQWAIVSKTYEQNCIETGRGQFIYYNDPTRPIDKVIGYFAYRYRPETDTVYNFGLYSFDKGNPIVGHDVFKKMEELCYQHHRVEWRVIDGNPVIRSYDKFCKRYGGNKITLHDVVRDMKGFYRDEHIYEIVDKKIIR